MRFGWMLAALAALVSSVHAESSGPERTDAILERFKHANQWRDHVMVVAHRAGVRENGRIVRAENSLAAIEAAIALGAEMVELDIQKTSDDVYVVLHDSWLDRTTTCQGRLVERSLADLASCRLVVEGAGEVTDETVPTLKDALTVARGRVLVNIDNKLQASDLKDIVAVARELGMEEQIIVKQNLWNRDRISEAVTLIGDLGQGARFMPIIADDAVKDVGFIETATKAVGADAAEMIAWRREAGAVTADGGLLFGARARAVATRGDWHLWVNTYAIVNKPAGYLAGGRGDELATIAANPSETFGFWAERGATMIQTDEPKAAIDWLTANGFRIPYDLTN
jgi:glycerophosphoryl diester phosphodiesterase